MKKTFYLWILPILSWIFVITLFVNLFVFNIIFYGDDDSTGMLIFAISEVVVFILFTVTSTVYASTGSGLRQTQKIVKMYISKYFDDEKIEFRIQNQISFEDKIINTIVTFENTKIEFSTKLMFSRRVSKSILKNKKFYQRYIDLFNSQYKQMMINGTNWQSGETTMLRLYIKNIEVKNQLMPIQFPFIYWNSDEFRKEMNAFLDKGKAEVRNEWQRPITN